MSFIRCIIFINICWATILLPNKYLLAQTITVPDPSFENAVYQSTTFYTWKTCQTIGISALNGNFTAIYNRPPIYSPTDGNLYLWLATSTLHNLSGSISVKLNTPTVKGRQHWFYIDAASAIAHAGLYADCDSLVQGKAVIYLGDSVCGMQQQIWVSPLLDTMWHRYKVTFVPDSNYQYMRLTVMCP